MSAERSHHDTTSAAGPASRAAPAITVDSILITSVPGMMTTMVLEAVNALNGLGKIAVATALSVVLWWVAEGRRRHGHRLGAALARHWRWALLGLASIAVLALVITRIVYGLPAPTTVIISSVAMAVLVAQAYLGRRPEPVAAAKGSAIAGAAIGLCLTIVF
jgi:drug/metabolite transporter (DMT)-like permease